jgi:hypothetical protein
VGGGCGDRQALLSRLDGGPGVPLLPAAGTPTTAIGWLDASRVPAIWHYQPREHSLVNTTPQRRLRGTPGRCRAA